jgi:hypothetical protein
MTQNEAKAALASKENDSAWVTKLNSGDVQTLQEFNNLTRLVSGYAG